MMIIIYNALHVYIFVFEGIIDDNCKFQEGGSILKKAKNYNNAIRQPMFKIPLDQEEHTNNVLIYGFNRS